MVPNPPFWARHRKATGSFPVMLFQAPKSPSTARFLDPCLPPSYPERGERSGCVDIAIVGPDQAGKSTVFDALAARHAQHGDARSEHLATVKVPDERLDKVAALIKPKKVPPVELVLHDLPTLFVKGRTASGEAAESLSRADGLILVVRAFRRADVPHPLGDVEPGRDAEEFKYEMLLNALGIGGVQLTRLHTPVPPQRGGDPHERLRQQVLLQRV